MYTNTRFRELLEVVNRRKFTGLAQEFGTDKHSKGFRSWDQFVALVHGQLNGVKSLRELEARFNAQGIHHYHLGTRGVKRATLSDANAKRDYRLYEAVAKQLLRSAHRKLQKQLKEFLYLIDASPIPLSGLGYDDWTGLAGTGRIKGLKLHMVYNPMAHVPIHGQVSAANVNDIEDAQSLKLEAGATYVFDKGYYDYRWWHEIAENKAIFVTRFKRNAALVELADWSCPIGDTAIVSDTQVKFTGNRIQGDIPGSKIKNPYQARLRQVVVRRDEHDEPLVLATNDFERSAEQIAGLYKSRWQIELFFKWLKQNLKVKQFLGRSENAVRTQIYIALITYLLLYFYKRRIGDSKTFKHFKAWVESTLFQHPKTDYERYRRKRRLEADLLEKQLVFSL